MNVILRALNVFRFPLCTVVAGALSVCPVAGLGAELLLEETLERLQPGLSVVQPGSEWRLMDPEEDPLLLQVIKNPTMAGAGEKAIAVMSDDAGKKLTVFNAVIAKAPAKPSAQVSFLVCRHGEGGVQRPFVQETVFDEGRAAVSVTFSADGKIAPNDEFGQAPDAVWELPTGVWKRVTARLAPDARSWSLIVADSESGQEELRRDGLPIYFGIPSATVNEDTGVSQFHDIRLQVPALEGVSDQGRDAVYLLGQIAVGAAKP